MSPATTPGLLLAGGATDNDDAMQWFLARSGGGDVVVLDAYGRDDYGPYIYSDLGGVDSVQSFVFKQRSASWDPFVLEKISERRGDLHRRRQPVELRVAVAGHAGRGRRSTWRR